MKNKKNKTGKVNDPQQVYTSGSALRFSSYKEQDKENYRYWLGLSPEQRLHNAVLMIKNIYAEQLKSEKTSHRLYFDQP